MLTTTRIVAAVLVLAVSTTGALAGTAGAKKKKLRPPTCDQTIAASLAYGNRFAADLTGQGFTPDQVLGHNYGYSDTCRLIGRSTRRGSGRITDYLPWGSDPDYEGQPFYVWSWYQIVTRLRTGKISSIPTEFSCRYGVQTGTGIGGARYC